MSLDTLRCSPLPTDISRYFDFGPGTSTSVPVLRLRSRYFDFGPGLDFDFGPAQMSVLVRFPYSFLVIPFVLCHPIRLPHSSIRFPYLYIRFHLAGDPHPFLFGSPAGMSVMY